VELFFQDLRYGWRMLMKTPGPTTVAIAAIALGIGANTAIFSLIDAVLIRTLPFGNSERLVVAGIQQPGDVAEYHPLGDADFLAWRDHQASFEQVAAFDLDNFSLTGHGLPQRIRGARVTSEFFSTLEVNAVLGRTFRSDEDRPSSEPIVVVSQSFWRTYLNSDSAAIGTSITLDGKLYRVVGVMPSRFHFPRRDDNYIWTVKTIAIPRSRPPYYLTAFGRLKPGVTTNQAQAELTEIASQVTRQFPTSPYQIATIVPLKDFMIGKVRLPLLVLSGAVCFVLLIALVNVANLLLARATARQKEMAVRRALGASRLRLIRQILTESLLLATIGGAAGLVLAKWSVETFVAFQPTYIPRISEVGINVRVLLFTIALSVMTGITFGLLPAVGAYASNLSDTLKEGSRTTSAGTGQRTRRWLVISEFALALMLVIGAGLLLRSFARLQHVNPGFDAGHLLTMHISLPETHYAKENQLQQFWLQTLERVQQLPGVKEAGISMSLPPNLLWITNPFTLEGQGFHSARPLQLAEEMSISRDYFKALKIPLIEGRFFTEKDGGATRVVIINEDVAKHYFPRQDPIGKRLQTGDPDPTAPWDTIIGVVGNVKYSGLDSPPTPQLYVPFNAADWIGWSHSMYLAIRTSGDPASLAPAVRKAIDTIDRDIPLANIATMDQLLDDSVAEQRFRTWLLGGFAALALLLASIGIYAVMSYSVGLRTAEIGIRMALGARPQDVLRQVLSEAAGLAAIGLVIGTCGALALTRTMSSLLFSVSASDPMSFATAALVLILAALTASSVPCRRATKINPVIALRYE
jgi:predicted permease